MPEIGGWSIGGGGGGGGGLGGFGSRPDSSNRPHNDRSPIGVPDDYLAVRPQDLTGMSATAGEGWAAGGKGHGSMVDRPPRYFEGAEWTPAGLSPQAIRELQMQMAMTGLLNSDFNPGVWDDPSVDAYKQLLSFANARGVTWEAALELYTQSVSETGGRIQWDPATGQFVPAGSGGTGTAGPPPLITRTTDPLVLKQIFRSAAIEQLGTGWDQTRVDSAVQAYNQLEVQRQQELYDMQVANMGQGVSGSVVEIPSAEAWIGSYIEGQDPAGQQANSMLNYTGEAIQLLGSPAWGVGGQQ